MFYSFGKLWNPGPPWELLEPRRAPGSFWKSYISRVSRISKGPGLQNFKPKFVQAFCTSRTSSAATAMADDEGCISAAESWIEYSGDESAFNPDFGDWTVKHPIKQFVRQTETLRFKDMTPSQRRAIAISASTHAQRNAAQFRRGVGAARRRRAPSRHRAHANDDQKCNHGDARQEEAREGTNDCSAVSAPPGLEMMWRSPPGLDLGVPSCADPNIIRADAPSVTAVVTRDAPETPQPQTQVATNPNIHASAPSVTAVVWRG